MSSSMRHIHISVFSFACGHGPWAQPMALAVMKVTIVSCQGQELDGDFSAPFRTPVPKPALLSYFGLGLWGRGEGIISVY